MIIALSREELSSHRVKLVSTGDRTLSGAGWDIGTTCHMNYGPAQTSCTRSWVRSSNQPSARSAAQAYKTDPITANQCTARTALTLERETEPHRTDESHVASCSGSWAFPPPSILLHYWSVDPRPCSAVTSASHHRLGASSKTLGGFVAP